MTRPGRLLTAQIREAATANAPERIAERRRHARAAELAIADREARFPELTAENAGAAIAYQDERVAFHRLRLLEAHGDAAPDANR